MPVVAACQCRCVLGAQPDALDDDLWILKLPRATHGRRLAALAVEAPVWFRTTTAQTPTPASVRSGITSSIAPQSDSASVLCRSA